MVTVEASVGAGVTPWNGILNVNKPPGWTSHDVVAKLRALLRAGKIGHAGTLDPAATGVLPVLVGKGTRIAEYLVDWDKEYWAVLRLGETTDTQDATGQVLQRVPTGRLTEEAIRSVIARFQGRLAQLPPMYSAVKVKGMPLYKAARAGRTVERGLRQVMIHEIEIIGIDGCHVSLRIVCSKGTYIRTLCADIGEALEVGGHLLTLERRRVGSLTIDRALSIEEIQSRLAVGRLSEAFVSLDAALESFPAVVVDDETATRVLHGVPIPLAAVRQENIAELVKHRQVRVKDPAGRLLAVGRVPAGDADQPMSGSERIAILKVLTD